MDATKGNSFRAQVDSVIAQKSAAIHAMSADTTPTAPHGGLLGRIDTARDEYVGAVAAQAALERVQDGPDSVLDHPTAQGLLHSAQTLTAVRAAVACVSSESAARGVEDVRRVVLRLIEDRAR